MVCPTTYTKILLSHCVWQQCHWCKNVMFEHLQSSHKVNHSCKVGFVLLVSLQQHKLQVCSIGLCCSRCRACAACSDGWEVCVAAGVVLVQRVVMTERFVLQQVSCLCCVQWWLRGLCCCRFRVCAACTATGRICGRRSSGDTPIPRWVLWAQQQ